ncbi:MAG TPA: hypothetical protein VHY22_09610 [Chthoniobacteraceae bacterium]|nr:hypothetical protein [Chthoniobacteraceae bacterium]
MLETHPHIGEFWHTVSELRTFFSGIKEVDTFPSSMRSVALKMRELEAAFCIDIFSSVQDRNIPKHLLRSDIQNRVVAGVEIHVISPEESIQNDFFETYRRQVLYGDAKKPDENLLSAVLVLKYGKSVIILGGDALKVNWEKAVERFQKLKIGKAQLLKVPHHGAANALETGANAKHSSYLRICEKDPPAKAVLFGGDSKHPECRVFEVLKEKTKLLCLSNGLRGGAARNPLGLDIDGACVLEAGGNVCNSHLGFEISDEGDVNLVVGRQCGFCA